MNASISIVQAASEDAHTLHHFICELARYEREPDAVNVTAAELAEQLAMNSPPFSCVLAKWNGSPVGMALYFFNYSTWRGRPGLYIEDLFVSPEFRGRGIGRSLLTHLAALAVERDCARMEWAVLDWNTPAIEFYRSLGAVPLDEWTVYRLTGDALTRLASP